MIGRNMLTLNEATMQAAVEHYLATHVLKPGHRLKIVGSIGTKIAPGGGTDYEVEVEPADEELVTYPPCGVHAHTDKDGQCHEPH